MKQKKLFLAAINTLLASWGGEAPPEVFWGLNDLLLWYSEEYQLGPLIPFDEDCSNIEEVLKQLE